MFDPISGNGDLPPAYGEESPSVRTHIYPFCGHTEDRDVDAAGNVLGIDLDEAIAGCPQGRDETGSRATFAAGCYISG